MTVLKRKVVQKTKDVLRTLSGNQCAYPGCKKALVEPATQESAALVNADICHIYAVSTKGPRGKTGLTEKELNSPGNLILLCPNHHRLVDSQHETYPATTLKKWKREHESKVQELLSADLARVPPDLFSHPYFPRALVEQKIREDTNTLRKSRFFSEFNSVRFSLALARQLINGELSGGSDEVRGRALAWCARFLSREKPDKAEEYLKFAKELTGSPETEIATAFIHSFKNDKKAALNILADINSPISRSATLMIVTHHDGTEEAIKWMATSNIKAMDLHADGKYFFLNLQLELNRWDDALETLGAINNRDLEEMPLLHHMIAITRLLTTVPTEFRPMVLKEVPFFNAEEFPLASDTAAIEARRKAQDHFTHGAKIARQLNCPVAARIEDQYALWLELKDPEDSKKGRQRLETKLRSPQDPSFLCLVPLGLQFKIKLDIPTVEKEIERQVSLHGGITPDVILARFAIAFTQENPEDIANYVSRHLNEPSEYINQKSVQIFKITMLSKAGLYEKANKCLNTLLEQGVSELEEKRIRRVIAEAKESDPIKPQKERFKETDSLEDLMDLVRKLESKQKWEDLCEYGEILFDRTGDVRDAEVLAKALSSAHKMEQLARFLETNADLLPQSRNLRILRCWSLYHEGALLEARSELEKLRDYGESDPNYRVLQITIPMALGDWNSLSGFIVKEYQQKDQRSPRDLMEAASLAINLGALQAKDLLFAAVQKGEDDASVLAAGYFLASVAGWENDEEVTHWLQRAAKLSGENGPIRNIALKDVLDQAPEWEHQKSDILPRLNSGEIPIFLAAELLNNRSFFDFTLFLALANQSENDPRHRGGIPAYSGKRQPTSFNTDGVIGIDITALLTLSFLGLLDMALDAFDKVRIPHSTLIWLFEEKRRTRFHQPSLIDDARRIRHFFATNLLENFVPSTTADSDLSALVGEELAKLIAEAEKAQDNDDVQRIVVRPSPVYRIASMMEEEADLTKHADVMSSCFSIVDKLREKGQLTAIEKKRACDYLQLHEKPWPKQPEIKDGAVLYLDDLSVTYFLHLGILEKLKAAGFKPIAALTNVFKVNELISYESISNEISREIEALRSALSLRIESERIKLGRRPRSDEPEKQPSLIHPSADMFTLTEDCDLIISDDRFFNQNETLNYGAAKSPVFSTLDLLNTLTHVGSITPEEHLEHRTRLRQAGYFFIPIDDQELTTLLTTSKVKNDKVDETAELKAIRENILHVRMNNWLQIPKEGPWLGSILKTFVRVLKKLWLTDADFPSIVARSNWIADQIDSRGWVHRFETEIGDEIVKTGRGEDILQILSPPPDAPQKTKYRYWNWVENRILAPIKEQYPDLYISIVDSQKTLIANLIDVEFADARDDLTDSIYTRPVLAQGALELTPPLIRTTLLKESDIQKEYGFKADSTITFDDFAVAFQRHELFDSIRRILSSVDETEVTDTVGRKWKLHNDAETEKETNLVISCDNQHIPIPNFALLSPDRKTRLKVLEEIFSEINLPTDLKNTWRNVLSEYPLEDEEFYKFHDDLTDTPVNIAELIRNEISNPQPNISRLVPNSRRYFERLVNSYDGSPTIQDYATSRGRQLFEQLSAWQPYDGFLLSLLLSSHPSLTAEISIKNLGKDELVKAFEFLEEYGDRISQLGAIEIGFRIIHEKPELEPFLIRLIKQIRDDDVDGKASGFKSLSALFFFSYGELSRTRLLSSEPPFYRRLASLSQATLIHRQLINSHVDIDSFCKGAVNQRGILYYMQSFADMRLQPRWNPDFAKAPHMKANFFARIMAAAKNFEKNLKNEELRNLVLGTGPESLHSLSEFPRLYYPGPLEGAEDRLNILPAEVSEAIEEQLGAKKITPLSFTALVNFAPFCLIYTEQAELAAEALKLGKYQLADIENKLQLLSILNGLATVAATVRSTSLADELRILVRKYRHDTQYALSLEECIPIYLVASASRVNLNDWRKYCGDWLTELAFGDLKGKDGETLYSLIQNLCHTVPELWTSCGKAHAALQAFNNS